MPTVPLCPNGHASNANGNCWTDGCVYRVISHHDHRADDA